MKKPSGSIVAYLANGWYERFVSIFTAIIIISCLHIFEGYWWAESFTIAYNTLIAAAIIDVLLPMRQRYLKWCLQIVAAVVITVQFARIELTTVIPEGTEKSLWWLERLGQIIPELHPFIWISLTVLIIHILFSVWAVTREKMFAVIGAAILLLTIADSFSPIWLWDNVAVVVFVGLIWILLSHLEKLQRTHPDSWGELLEYPIRVVTPALIVLSLLMVISLNAPSVAPLLQDPYTIWRNAMGQEVQVRLGDKAIITENNPISVANASSGYSRNDTRLGGGFDYDFSPMMMVSTSHKSYWRGETKATYTGEGWIEERLERSNESVEQNELLLEDIPRDRAETVDVEQIVTMVREDAYPVLFAAAPISKVNWIGGEAEPFPTGLSWSSDYWELKWNADNSYPTMYAVTSTVTVLDEAGLREVEANIPDSDLSQQYLQLPSTVTDRVKQLALDVTAAGANDYDKARLLESYLSRTYSYNNKPDLSKLSGNSFDFVDQFLFELKEGYCDYFSTAMAIMARSLDMPTRWVKGFSPGTLPNDRIGPPEGVMDGDDVNPLGTGTYTVLNSDAHSWVEVYFEGYGWIPFEATAGFDFPYTAPEGEEIAAPEMELNDVSEVTEVSESENNAGNKVLFWGAFSALIAVILALLIIRRRDLAGIWIKLKTGSFSSNDQIVMETTRLLRACKKRGFERYEHETLREAISRWSLSQKRLSNDFQMVVDRFEEAKYGAGTVTKEEADLFVAKVRYLISEIK